VSDSVVGQRVVITEIAADPLTAIERAIVEPMERPDPASLGDADVLVEVKSASVGWVDLIMAAGQYQHVPATPYTPGLEYAGVVAWAGSAVTHVHTGDRVLVDGFTSGPRSHGAYQRYGGFASYAVAPAVAVHPIPGALTFDEACNLLGNYETAYHALVARGRVVPGETVLVHGASGSTGLAAVHLAKLLGATVIATGRSAAKLEVVRAQGADHVIELAPGAGIDDLRDRVKALTRGRGVDVVHDGVGGDLARDSLRCLRFGGRYLIVGWASTPGVATPLPTNLIMMKGLDVLGCPAVISVAKDPSLRPPRLAQILAWASAGQLVPFVSRRFALGEFRAALRAKWHGEVIGGCVVNP
jgi:NADPH:quinone reductase